MPRRLGCGDEYKLDPTGDGPEHPGGDGAPDIELDRDAIDFGAMSVGDGGARSEVVTAFNLGEADLQIQSIELSAPNAPYTIGAVESVLLPPNLTSFSLTDYPVPSTITVIVDSIQVNTGWEYDAQANAAQFDEDSVPEGGSIIEVDYALLGDCER